MKMVLLVSGAALAALAFPAAEAKAQAGQWSAAPGAAAPAPSFQSGPGRPEPGDRRRGRGFYPFAYPVDLEINRSWEPDSYNDWWHERTERSYPRWMSNNQGCERQWWGGGAWRC